MSNCTPCTPANDELPIFCDPYPATDTAKRLLVEDEAFCQKALTSPTTPNQILKTNSSGNIQWGTVNSVLQSGPVDLGNQPLTTTGAINAASVTTTGVITGTSAIFNAPLQVEGTITIGRQNSSNEGGEIRIRKALDNEVSWLIDVYGSTSTPSLRLVEQTSPTTAVTRFEFKTNGTINITTITTYANNAAALAGGLVVGDVYKTATGELRIVV